MKVRSSESFERFSVAVVATDDGRFGYQSTALGNIVAKTQLAIDHASKP